MEPGVHVACHVVAGPSRGRVKQEVTMMMMTKVAPPVRQHNPVIQIHVSIIFII